MGHLHDSKERNLVNRIADASTRLLSAEDICEKLSIFRSTFDRWV
jgi:predicted DNA-binding transcriptional regulator AlpA